MPMHDKGRYHALGSASFGVNQLNLEWSEVVEITYEIDGSYGETK
jgi:hypothetical protein